MNTTFPYKYILVEDEYLIRKNLIKKISSLNLPFELAGEANNGQDAVELIKNNSPSLVITDIKMPQFNGIGLIKYIHDNHPHIKMMILSGYNDFKYAQAGIKYGIKDFLLKPVKIEELSASLNNIFLILDSENKDLHSFSIDSNKITPENLSKLLEDYFLNNYASITSLNLVSDKFGFSNEYLCKTFKKYIGLTPIKYITKIRINEAKHLLINSPDLEIKKIGDLVGYKDSFYFSKVFKANTGVYPSEYRNSHFSK
ncbi:response regulator transcription factor [Clostridium butyricum]|uniref:response regulator transcription factor n=1 Tax=Clostridium butyricum TaxID=1492 RepID=UPI0032BFE481